MNKRYYFLELDGVYVVLAGEADTDRLGLIGATFSTATRAREYVEVLNQEGAYLAEAALEADNDTETS